MINRFRATSANQHGRVLAEKGDYAGAIPHYLEAVRLAPSWATPWFNLGIAYKHTGDFAGSLRASERALSIDREEAGDGAVWNLGIAATALGDWTKARQAWKAFGIAIPDDEGPIDTGGTVTPIRLNPRGEAEVVWTLRIDPARARIRSIPLPTSGHRYDDLLLHDGAPNGYRRFQGQDVPVFDELKILEPSGYQTWKLALVAPTEEDIDDLLARLRDVEVPAEDWTASVRHICEKCSTGKPHEHHGDEQVPAWSPRRDLAIALRGGEPQKLLSEWAAAAPGRDFEAPLRAS